MQITCQTCGQLAPRTGNFQRYCNPCSAEADAARKAKHSNRKGKAYGIEARSRVADKGRELNKLHLSIPDFDEPVFLGWHKRMVFPFSWAASKNAVFSSRPEGHRELRIQAKEYRAKLTRAMMIAFAGAPIANNKLWIDLLVQKPNHRGDASNVVNAICDSLKQAIGLDDRWFAFRRIDWQIVKAEPKLIIQIGQEEGAYSVHVCSSCGRLLDPVLFPANRGAKNGRSRNCFECSGARKKVKAKGPG